MLLSASALLTVNAFAPQMFWDHNKVNGRFPSSLEEDRLEKLEQDKKDELKKKEEEIAVQCLKDKSSKLEDEIKKLVDDKKAILKQLADLKKDKKEDKEDDADDKEDKKEDKKDKKGVAKVEQQDVLGIMSQLTSLMLSQQEQQMMMMDQMFSMMSSMQRPQAQYQRQSPYDMFSPVSSYMSPYAYNHNSFNNMRFSQYNPYGEFSDYPLMGNVGINYGQAMDADYDYRRAPSNEGQKFERGYFQPEAHNMQSQTPVPHDGFDFGATTLSNFNRVRFE